MAGFGGGGFTPGRHDLDGNFTVRDGDISGSQAGIFVGGIVTEGNLDVSGSFTVKGPTTVISASHLVINDSMIGLGFAGDQDLTGAVGDRGMVYGLTGDLNQAFFWDQTSGSFVLGKVKDQGPAYETLDVADANLSMLRNGGLLSIGHISGSAFGTFVGGLVTEGDLDVSGSTALGAVTMAAISGSSTLDIKGDTFLNGDLNVTGSGKTIRAAALDLGDGNITNVGDIALDSISSDAGTSITVTLGVDAGDDFIVGNNNAFVVEGDNDRVGIGVTDPEALLHVHTGDSGQAPHATADDLFIESDGAAGMSIFGGQDNSARIYFGSSRALASGAPERAGQIDYNLQNNVMKLATSGSTRITIDSAGDVGIGVTDPDAQLEVFATSTQLKLSYDGSNANTFTVDATGELTIDNNSNVYTFGDGAGSQVIVVDAGDDSNSDLYLNTDAHHLCIRAMGGFEQGVISLGDDCGRQLVLCTAALRDEDWEHAVQTNPTLYIHSAEDPDTDETQWVSLAHDQTDARLEVGKGSLVVKSTPTTDNTPVVLTLQTGETDIAADEVIGQIDFQAPDEGAGTDAILVAASIAAISEGDFAADNNATALVLKTGASEAAAEKVRITSAGNVGIGTTSPTAVLNVESTSPAIMHISRDGSATAFNSANWGLGTLGFGGQDSDSGEDNDAALIEVKTSQAWTNSAHGTYMAFSTTADDATSTTEHMRINNAGNVGIGATNPLSQLHISGTTLKQVLTLENNGGRVDIGMAGGGSDILAGSATGDLVISNETGNDILFGTQNAQRMIIDYAGNVGIGPNVDPPREVLSVSGSTIELRDDGTPNSNPGISIENDSRAYKLQTRYAAGANLFAIRDSNAGANRISILTTGEVGVGSDTPATRLQVGAAASTATETLTIKNDQGVAEIGVVQTAADIIATSDAGDLVVNNVDGNDILFATSDTQRMIIDSAGNVGIGTMDPPAYLLEINGTCDHGGSTSWKNGEIGLIGWNVGNHEWIYKAAAGIDISWGADNKDDQMYLSGSTGNVGIGTITPAGSSAASVLDIENITTSAVTEGGNLRLSSNDGAALGDTHRLGVVEFAAAEDASNTITVGAKIEAVADAAWGAAENGANLDFYTTDGDAVQTKRMSILATGDMDLNYATATAPGGGFDGSGLVYKSTVAKVNGLIETQIWIDLGAATPASHKNLTNSIIGEAGVADAYITKLTNAVNGFIIRAELYCLETPVAGGVAGEADIGLGASSNEIAAGAVYTTGTNQSLAAFTGFSGAASAGALTTGDQNVMAAGLDDLYLYVYMALSGQPSNGSVTTAYTAGQFLIKLYGVDNIV